MCVSRQPVTHPHTHAQTTIRICVRASTFSSFRMKKKQDTKRHFSLRGAQKEAAVQVFIGIANVATLLSHRGDFVPLFPLHTHTQKLRSWRGGTHRAGVLFFERWGLIYTYIYTYILVLIFFHIFFCFFWGFCFLLPPFCCEARCSSPPFPLSFHCKGLCFFFSGVGGLPLLRPDSFQ